MLAYSAHRILATIPIMVIVALVVFSLLYFAPGDPAAILAGDMATTADIARIRQQLNLDQPFLVRFGGWMWSVLQGDLGTSIYTSLPVTELFLQRLEPTLALAACTMLFVSVTAIPLGMLAAWQVGKALDRGVMGFAVFGFSVPVFVVAYILIYILSVWLRLLPVQGYVSPVEGLGAFIKHLILPSAALSLTLTALIARITRASMLEVLGQDYIRTARAKGLGEGPVLIRHALKNAAVPIVTTVGVAIAMIIGGVVITETVFAIPGLGSLTVDAVLRRDYPVIQGVILAFSAIYVLVNLLVDLSYCLFDPRIQY